ncbi:hypothetical protein BDQ17DRAFT_1354533 [Cyathus striatus]|nr:hypothetical protein BDQ17DRAFT_1354533 [Cyathus striatus]
MVQKDTSVNPDSRPLPPGWNEHYDFARQTWYYVYLNGPQPRVSLTHPAELILTSRPPLVQGSSSSGQAVSLPKRAPNLSFAQQLYASALPKNAPAFVSGNAEPPRSSLPTPPPTNSPSPRWSPPIIPTVPTPPINTLNIMGDIRPSNELYNSVISTRQPRLSSHQASLPDRQSIHHHRSSTMSTSSGVRHLITTARPPSLGHSQSMSNLPDMSTPVSPGLHRQQASVGSSVNSSSQLTPPPNTLYPPKPILSASTTPLLPLSVHSITPTSPTPSSHSSTGSQTGQMLAEVGKSLAKALGKAALQTAGHTIKTTFFGADTVSDIVTSLAGVSTSQLGLGIPQVEAVLQGGITADYQAVINALMNLQHRPNLQPQQLAHPIDYPALIAKLQKAQEMANAQLRQLQLLAQQQQQVQHNAHAFPPSAAQYQAPFQPLASQQPSSAISPTSQTSFPPSSPTYQLQNTAYQAIQQQQQHQAQQNFTQQLATMQQTSQVEHIPVTQLQQQQQQVQSQEAQFQAALNAQPFQLYSQTPLYQNVLAGQSQGWQNSLIENPSQVALDAVNVFGVTYDQPPLTDDPPPFDPEMLYQESYFGGNFGTVPSSLDDSGRSNLLGNLNGSMLSDATSGFNDNFTNTVANFPGSIDMSPLVPSWGSDS